MLLTAIAESQEAWTTTQPPTSAADAASRARDTRQHGTSQAWVRTQQPTAAATDDSSQAWHAMTHHSNTDAGSRAWNAVEHSPSASTDDMASRTWNATVQHSTSAATDADCQAWAVTRYATSESQAWNPVQHVTSATDVSAQSTTQHPPPVSTTDPSSQAWNNTGVYSGSATDASSTTATDSTASITADAPSGIWLIFVITVIMQPFSYVGLIMSLANIYLSSIYLSVLCRLSTLKLMNIFWDRSD